MSHMAEAPVEDEEDAPPKKYEDCWLAGQQVKTFIGTFENAQPMHYAPRGRHMDKSLDEQRAAKYKLLEQFLMQGEHPGDLG